MDVERGQLLSILESKGIWYMPLKGAILKTMYPGEGMRQMSDNDILFDPASRREVRDIMTGRGYEVDTYGVNHADDYKKPPVYHIEMHVGLFDVGTHSAFAVEYYEDVKDRLLPDGKSQYGYRFTDEDFYIYMTVHEYKHYIRGGTGLRSLLDCYIFMRAKGQELDLSYVEGELKKLGVDEYEKKRRALSMKLFSDPLKVTLSEDEEKFLAGYTQSGTYGTVERMIQQTMERESKGKKKKVGKLGYALRRIFPPQEKYAFFFPRAYKYKILLPFFWVFRIFHGILAHPGRLIYEFRVLKGMKKKGR